ncbi:hypothetical protein [Erythrobacter sp. KY5]|nr:hypothetical protein [Erythrobacter sp. KY5]
MTAVQLKPTVLAGRTFLYIVSDDNFSSSQRTLLMKFEWVGAGR